MWSVLKSNRRGGGGAFTAFGVEFLCRGKGGAKGEKKKIAVECLDRASVKTGVWTSWKKNGGKNSLSFRRRKSLPARRKGGKRGISSPSLKRGRGGKRGTLSSSSTRRGGTEEKEKVTLRQSGSGRKGRMLLTARYGKRTKGERLISMYLATIGGERDLK